LRSPHTQPASFVVCTAAGESVQERNIRRALDAAKEAAGLDATEREDAAGHVTLRREGLGAPAARLARIAGFEPLDKLVRAAPR